MLSAYVTAYTLKQMFVYNVKHSQCNITAYQCGGRYCITNLPTGTPYVGALMETGIWAAMDQLNYATLMYYHSVINSEECLVTKIVLKYMYISSSVRRFMSAVQLI